MRESPGGRSPSGAGRFLTQGYKDFSPNVMMLCCAGVCSLSATARLPGPLHRGAPKPLAESQWVKRVVHPRSTSTENMRTFVSSKQLCNSIFKFVEWRLLWGTERRGKNHVFPKMCYPEQFSHVVNFDQVVPCWGQMISQTKSLKIKSFSLN